MRGVATKNAAGVGQQSCVTAEHQHEQLNVTNLAELIKLYRGPWQGKDMWVLSP